MQKRMPEGNTYSFKNEYWQYTNWQNDKTRKEDYKGEVVDEWVKLTVVLNARDYGVPYAVHRIAWWLQ